VNVNVYPRYSNHLGTRSQTFIKDRKKDYNGKFNDYFFVLNNQERDVKNFPSIIKIFIFLTK
jgi:hypothetical protein